MTERGAVPHAARTVVARRDDVAVDVDEAGVHVPSSTYWDEI